MNKPTTKHLKTYEVMRVIPKQYHHDNLAKMMWYWSYACIRSRMRTQIPIPVSSCNPFQKWEKFAAHIIGVPTKD